MFDLQLFVPGTPTDGTLDYSSSSLNNHTIQGITILTNKVLKFLLTEVGTYLLDPTYGSSYLQVENLNRSSVSTIQINMEDDVVSCVSYIQGTETFETPEEERLQSVTIIGFKTDSDINPTYISVMVEVLNILGDKAILPIKR